MKTATIKLTDSLMKLAHKRAKRSGLKVEETLEEIVRKGLLDPVDESVQVPRIGKDSQYGFPIVLGGRKPNPAEVPTDDEIKEMMLAEETEKCLAFARR